MENKLYIVYVRDRLTKAEVRVGDMLTKAEATRIKKILEEFGNDIVVIGFTWKKGRFYYDQ